MVTNKLTLLFLSSQLVMPKISNTSSNSESVTSVLRPETKSPTTLTPPHGISVTLTTSDMLLPLTKPQPLLILTQLLSQKNPDPPSLLLSLLSSSSPSLSELVPLCTAKVCS